LRVRHDGVCEVGGRLATGGGEAVMVAGSHERPWGLGRVPRDELRAGLGLWRAELAGAEGISRRRNARIAALTAHAVARSPFYADHWRGVRVGAPLSEYPPVTKPELMARFDDWVTDPQVSRAGVESFVADPGLIGTSYLGRYFVCTSSGTTGRRALFVHDRGAIAVYRVLNLRAEFHYVTDGTFGTPTTGCVA